VKKERARFAKVPPEHFIPRGSAVVKLDHLALTIQDLSATRDWYGSVLGLEVEFDMGTVAGLKDEADFTVILSQDGGLPSQCALYFQVEDVDVVYKEMANRGVIFRHAPQINDWGYGAGLTDPDGRLIGLWDENSMREHDTS
jgi:predicted enzyme related to lactoylglutathione lyase